MTNEDIRRFNRETRRIVKIDPKAFKDLKFEVTVKPTGMERVKPCDCFGCELINNNYGIRGNRLPN